MTSRKTLIAGLAMLALGVPAQAQVIGSFTWQTQPHCNVVTLTVIQQGGLFQLAGSDNLCGTGSAPVTGTAVAAAGGSAALGFTIALSSGRAAHITAIINLLTLSGTWADGDGNTGTFLFGGNTGGSPRPAPASASTILVTQFSSSVYGGTGVAPTIARSDHTHDDRYFTQTQLSGLNAAVRGGNGEGVGGNICTLPNGIEIFIRDGFGQPVNARFSFIVPGFAHGQIRSDGSIRTGTANLTSVQHPSTGAFCLVFNAAPGQVAAEATLVSIHAEQ